MAAFDNNNNNNNQAGDFKVSLSSFSPPHFPFDESKEILTDILCRIETPAEGTRSPADICCVVDVSGSMGIECSNGDAESQGLNVLSVVQHACKTVAHSLLPQDRFCLVKYSSEAEVVLKMTNMDNNGMKKADSAIDALREGGQTNLWDGLLEGLKALDDGSGRMKAVFLLTDGQPNVNPPRGIVPAFLQYKESHEMKCTVSTFGFGYNLDSALLNDLAKEGQGRYAFIPDGSFVGTVFVNAVSNVLCTAGQQAVAKVSGLNEVAAAHATVPAMDFNRASWGIHVPIGSLMFGQTRDFVISVPTDMLGDASGLHIDVEFSRPGNSEMETISADGISMQNDSEAMTQGCRLRTVRVLREFTSKSSPYGGVNTDVGKVATFEKNRKELLKYLRLMLPNVSEGDTRLSDIIVDVDGQVRESVEKAEPYRRWGRHYLPSLVAAHHLQECNNFKDPGVQHYGGPLFKQIRDTAEQTFIKLPPPKPTIHAVPVYGSAQVITPRVNMAAFYNAGGGCVSGDSKITMADGATKRVDQLVSGEVVEAFKCVNGKMVLGHAKVRFVAEMKLDAPALLVTLPGGLKITAWHPVLLPQLNSNGAEENRWVFPASIAVGLQLTPKYHSLDAVFNICLENEDDTDRWHGVLVDGIPAITLAHQIQDDAVASHAYFGTDVVVREMERCPRNSLGHFIVQTGASEQTKSLSVDQQKAELLLDVY